MQCGSKGVKSAEDSRRLYRCGSACCGRLLRVHREQEPEEVQEVPRRCIIVDTKAQIACTTECILHHRLLVSLMSVEFLISFELMFEVWDIFTESVSQAASWSIHHHGMGCQRVL